MLEVSPSEAVFDEALEIPTALLTDFFDTVDAAVAVVAAAATTSAFPALGANEEDAP